MKIFVSKEYGCIYHIFNGELAFTPMSVYSDIYELDGDKPLKECFLHGETGLVEWENIEPELVEPLRAIERELKDELHATGMSKIQEKMIKEPCPHCKTGKLRAVAEEDTEQETCLWCNSCLCSVDTSGGYVLP